MSGRYHEGARQSRSSVASYDPELARELWETSAALVAPFASTGAPAA